MGTSSRIQEFPVIGRLIARVKQLATLSARTSELRRLDDRQVGEIAHDLGLSRPELFALCANSESEGLLKKRLAQFNLTEEAIARQHPDVLHDL
ncbi:hypothetical protein JQ628_14885 [Bradyrhizobium lablabi]|uniref:hypothetical protein n=1 Tax=Bradyrhizobium lablabi TaxID=722472 RepID=UPI001BADB321|nr:hypothetical protein [Bradyrhizobium lablabi]MBR1122811.1 hypothetical protein [Bradyrhizobium lablabi]